MSEWWQVGGGHGGVGVVGRGALVMWDRGQYGPVCTRDCSALGLFRVLSADLLACLLDSQAGTEIILRNMFAHAFPTAHPTNSA